MNCHLYVSQMVLAITQNFPVAPRAPANLALRLTSLPVPTDSWELIFLDFPFGLTNDRDGNTGNLVFVERLSKIDHLADVTDFINGKGTVMTFIDPVFFSTLSDRDSCLNETFWISIL